ncbi:hypothetical protein FHS86_002497 [Roseimarinus sediminis]
MKEEGLPKMISFTQIECTKYEGKATPLKFP